MSSLCAARLKQLEREERASIEVSMCSKVRMRDLERSLPGRTCSRMPAEVCIAMHEMSRLNMSAYARMYESSNCHSAARLLGSSVQNMWDLILEVNISSSNLDRQPWFGEADCMT